MSLSKVPSARSGKLGRAITKSRREVTRRTLVLAGAQALALPAAADESDQAPVEAHMRLKDPPAAPPMVILTLDACSGGFDRRIAATLIENRVRATVFLTAGWIRRNPYGLAVLREHADLFDLENHGFAHVPPVLGTRRIFGIAPAGSLAAVEAEAVAGARVVADATGIPPRWYRGATGFYSPAAMARLRQLDFAIAGFSLNGDMGASLPTRVVARRIAVARSGDVIVAHVNQPSRPSGAGVAAGILALIERGFEFERLDAWSPQDFLASSHA